MKAVEDDCTEEKDNGDSEGCGEGAKAGCEGDTRDGQCDAEQVCQYGGSWGPWWGGREAAKEAPSEEVFQAEEGDRQTEDDAGGGEEVVHGLGAPGEREGSMDMVCSRVRPIYRSSPADLGAWDEWLELPGSKAC